jgi:NADPH:quinone reductase-like Zn-dependent oxidoreductase
MKAAVYRKFGGPEVVRIEDVPRPTPAPNEVLIRVHASTVSVADYRSRSKDLPKGMGFFGPLSLGIFGPRKRILGMDVAGVIEQIGSGVTRFSIGDKVIAMRGSRFGGHAEYAVMPETGTIAMAPTNLSLEDAVSLIFGGITARQFLNLVTLAPGAEVLVNGASGSTGSAAVQLAVALGARVTGVSSAVNHELVRSLGASEVIDYAATDFAANGKTYDVIIDCVGNAGFDRVSDSIKPGGALLLVVGDLHSMLTVRRDSKRSGKLVTMTTPGATASDMEYLVQLAEAGKFVPVVDRTYSLDEIVEAHRYVGTGRKRGNLVLRLS